MIGRVARISALLVLGLMISACADNAAPSTGNAAVSSLSPAITDAPSSTPTLAPTPSPNPTATPSPSPNPTPSPTPTPIPAPTPLISLAHCTGKSAGSSLGGSMANTSSNWSGYIVTKPHATVSCVEGSFVVPRISSCPPKGQDEVSIWVGIGGYQSNDLGLNDKRLEQTGVDAWCYNGKAYYEAWSEVWPRQPVSVTDYDVDVKPGDVIWAKVSASGHNFAMTVVNVTAQEQETVTATVKDAPRLTAEWIVESPSIGCPRKCKTEALAKFSTITISGGKATIGGLLGSIESRAWARDIDTMTTSNANVVRDRVSALDKAGQAFSVTWRHY